MPTPDHIRWPLRTFPVCMRGGTFPMNVPGCNVAYRHPTLALHLHDYSGTMWIGARRLVLEPGDITLSPGGKIPSRYALQESGQHLCLHIAWPAGKQPAMRLPLHLRLGPAVAEARERIWRVIDHHRLAGTRRDSAAACASCAALQELMLWLHLKSERSAGPHRSSLVDEAMRKLEQAIEASLTKPMLLGDLAAGVGLSTDYVARAFARRYGMRLQHYLLLRRIELARHLLVSSNLPVSEIGRQVGLPDPQYFNKQFRRIANVSPLAYRTQHTAA
ncbi:MAG TPA: AraC family transcriptional regulator [Candidatus Methylacidiphilales bacterium]|jgi:AraC-like DNA-binding protein|nr:AraC family transcriptional regulator [Candidatus Methylacidiphilales bacterium]